MVMGMSREELLAFNRRIIEEFRGNGGKCGGMFEGNPMLLVTMKGAKTGRELTTPLTYYAEGDRYVVMASAAGSPTHPAWYRNLLANPAVMLEVGSEEFPAVAAEAAGTERERLFAGMVAAMPRFGEYQAATERQIPVIVFTRAKSN